MLIEKIDAYGYPLDIKKVINEFVGAVNSVFENMNVGVLLIGSASRGELCWGLIGDKETVFSDIEFIVAVDSVTTIQRNELLLKIDEIERRYPLGTRFHLDHVVIKWPELKTVEKRILVFDSKNTGIDLTIHSVKECLPDITKSNINFNELNDVLLHRMKSIVKEVPDGISLQHSENREFVLSIAKNSLDITTWLFPYEAEELASGFKNRLNLWKKKGADLLLSNYIDDDFSFLADCLEIRMHPEKQYDTPLLLNKYINIYSQAIDYCKNINNINCNLSLSNNTVSKKLFFEYKFKRRLIEALYILRYHKIFNVSNIITNIFMPRKGKQVVFCFEMINALKAHLDGSDDVCRVLMDNSWLMLGELRKTNKREYNSHLDEWLELRDCYVTLNKIFI